MALVVVGEFQGRSDQRRGGGGGGSSEPLSGRRHAQRVRLPMVRIRARLRCCGEGGRAVAAGRKVRLAGLVEADASVDCGVVGQTVEIAT